MPLPFPMELAFIHSPIRPRPRGTWCLHPEDSRARKFWTWPRNWCVPLGVWCETEMPRPEFTARVEQALHITPLVMACGPETCRRIGILTGAGGSLIPQAAAEWLWRHEVTHVLINRAGIPRQISSAAVLQRSFLDAFATIEYERGTVSLYRMRNAP